MTSTFDNCCQRAKVHRLVTLPVQSCKMSWSCCVYFSQVFALILGNCIIFLSVNWRPIIFLSVNWRPIIFLSVNWRLIIFLSVNWRLLIFLSPIQRIIIFLSPIQLIIIWVFSKCKQALIFILNVSQRFPQILCWVSTYIFSLIVSQRAILFILAQLLFLIP